MPLRKEMGLAGSKRASVGGGENNSVLNRLGLNPVKYPGKDETLGGRGSWA